MEYYPCHDYEQIGLTCVFTDVFDSPTETETESVQSNEAQYSLIRKKDKTER